MSDSGLPYWLLYSLILIMLLLFRKVLINWVSVKPHSYGLLPAHVYCKDEFYGVVWRWRYPSQHNLRPEEFVAFCPICDLELLKTQFESHVSPVILYCDKCRKPFTIESETASSILDYMGREIPRRIRSGEWRESTSGGAAE